MSFKNHSRQLFSLIVLCSVFTLFASVSFATVGPNWIEQWGITWTFDKNISLNGSGDTYQYGQFVNGDYWIMGPVNITAISPQTGTTGSRSISGSMLNPMPSTANNGVRQGYDTYLDRYDASLNVAFGISASNPLSITSDASLVSVESLPQTGTPCIKTAAVLTILESPPATNAFRPAYCGTEKVILTEDMIDYSHLASLVPVAGMPSFATAEEWFERVWLDHMDTFGVGGRRMHPQDNMPDYGRDMHALVAPAALMLHTNHTIEQKRTLLLRFLQLGIDNYGVIANGGRECWKNNGGHGTGRKWPILFAGIILDNNGMKNIGQKSGNYCYTAINPTTGNRYWQAKNTSPFNSSYQDPPDYIHFGQDDQICYITQEDVDFTHGLGPGAWNPDSRATAFIPYETEDIGLPAWILTHSHSGAGRGNNHWSTPYVINVSCTLQATQLAALIMTEFDENGNATSGAKVLWNHDAYFDYADRYMVGTLPGGEAYGNARSWGTGGPWLEAMWDTYRSNYGPIWPNTGPPAQQYTLTTSAVNGSVTKSPNQNSYNSGQTVTLTATPSSGYIFSNWSGDLSGSSNPATITMNSNKTVTANFSQAPAESYTLSTFATNGSITKSPDKTDYTAGEAVTLTAVPNTGYSFVDWSGSATGTNNPLILTMNADMSVTASFTLNQPQGETYYISPLGSSGYTGLNWSQAWRQLPATLERGATYYLAGGSYSTLSVSNTPSGTELITIKKATTHDHGTNTGWQSTFGTTEAVFPGSTFINTSYVTLDGQMENAIRIEWNPSGGIGGRVLEIQDSQHLAVKYCEIDGRYAEQNGSQTAGACTLVNLLDSSDITIDHSIMHDAADDGMQIHHCSELNITYNEIYNLHGCGTDGNCGPCYNGHSDGIELFHVDNSEFIGNFIHNVSSTSSFFPLGGTAHSSNLTLANNIFYNNNNTGFVAYIHAIDGIRIYNNVFWGQASGRYGGLALGNNLTNMEMYNNVILSVNYSHMGASFNAVEHVGDYNIIGVDISEYPESTHDQIVSNPGFIMINGASGPLVGNVVKEDFMLNDGSPCINTGTAVSNTSDILGTLRPQDGAFDIGAFEVQSGSTPTTYTLSINATNGSVVKSPDKAAYNAGETVTLTAMPNTGYSFENWTDNATGTTNPVTITMDSNKIVTANFTSDSLSIDDLLSSAVTSQLFEQTFDATNTYQTLSTAGWNLSANTITLWANPGNLSGSHYIFGHTTPGAWGNRIQIYLRDSTLSLGLGDTHSLQTNLATLQTDQWYFISLSWNGINYTVKVNDQIVGSGTYTGLTALEPFADIGNNGMVTDRTEPFVGIIDDVRVYNRALSNTETNAIYTYGHLTIATPVAHWLFDDHEQSTTAIDSSGNNYTATLLNSPVWGIPWKYEEYIRFDGGDQAAEVSCESLQAESGTVALWVEPETTIGHQVLFGHANGSGNLIQLHTEDGRLGVVLGSTNQLTTDTLEPGVMYYVAMTWNGTEYVVYLDGEQKAMGTFPGLTAFAATADIANMGTPETRTIFGFEGIVDDVQLYSRALSADEIKALYYTVTVKENRTLTFLFDGGPLYTVQNLPTGASFNTTTQELVWKPWYDQAGDHTVLFVSQDQSDQQTVTLSVQDVQVSDWYREFLEQNGKL